MLSSGKASTTAVAAVGYHLGVVGCFFLSFFSCIPFFPRTTLALFPSSNSNPGSHSGPSSPLLTTIDTCLHFYREEKSVLPFLVDSRRIALVLRS